MLYQAADRYMKEHLNGRTTIPVKEWQTERNKLINEKTSLTADYQKLKAEIRNIEILRQYAEKLDDNELNQHVPERKEMKHEL